MPVKDPCVNVTQGAGDSLILRHPAELSTTPRTLIDILQRQAEARPNHTFLAERNSAGEWERLTYGQAKAGADAIAQALLDRGLGKGDTALILSGNSIAHALFLLGAMSIGVMVAPTSPQYALIPDAHGKLVGIADKLRPAIVFAQDAAQFAAAVHAIGASDRLVAVTNVPTVAGAVPFESMLNTVPGPGVAAAVGALTPDTAAKILFTSGSTGWPKGVINTHRMMCTNLDQGDAMWRAQRSGGDILSWLPWNHTMAGNAMFNSTLHAGAAYYLDDGRPTSAREFARTIRNLRELDVTTYSDVPLALSLLADALEQDAELCSRFFARLEYISYAGAALPEEIGSRLQRLAVAATGMRIPVISGYGSTETAPGLLAHCWASEGTGYAGLPYPGIDIKLLPLGDGRFEIRARGPNITPGYLEEPERTVEAFDEEGFFRMGDAVRFVDPADPSRGLRFAGRLAEDFKLLTGTFVNAGSVRAALVSALSPLVNDALIIGEGHANLAALVWLNLAQVRALAPEMGAEVPVEQLVAVPAVRAVLASRLAAYNCQNRSSSLRVDRLRVLCTPPSIQENEITDKGYINRAKSLQLRAADVEAAYAVQDVLTIEPEK
ncbi:feruloyl-CoA synthase [Novosphingobium sp. 1529]|uniref:AMP-binding protein n=1 Tax=Novosphingobium sp. 1529 TaxID=3156424 RepID=UPI003392F161